MKKLSLPSILFLTGWAIMSLASSRVGNCQVATMEKESDLLGVLTGDAPGADKAIACKRLAIYGSETAAPELAKLLGDEKLASRFYPQMISEAERLSRLVGDLLDLARLESQTADEIPAFPSGVP